jgi:aminoglycoside 6'-N-acetyltransferase I
MTMTRFLMPEDAIEWQRMRNALWSDVPAEELASEMKGWLEGDGCAVIVAERQTGGLCGFLELAIRPCAVNGELGRFGYVEGWYVDSDVRQQGIGRSLVRAAERWLLARGVDEIHSDAVIENRVSQSSHRAIGFVEVDRLVHFRKKIQNTDK